MNLKDFMDRYKYDDACIVEFFENVRNEQIKIQEKDYSKYEVVYFGVFLGDLEIHVKLLKNELKDD